MSDKKVLYISDLDGTLLNFQGKLSKYTIDTINNLIKDGMIFSFATARSIVTAGKICKDLNLNVPVIVHNGIFITDSKTNEIIFGNYLEKTDAKRILETLNKNGIYPFAHAIIDNKERISYCKDYLTDGMKHFIDERKNDNRLNKVDSENVCLGDVFHFTCIDENDKLLKMNELFKDDFHCIYYEDIYSHKMWLEILPKNVTKGNTILKLKEILNCDKVVCFGDGVNDMSMFKMCDEGYVTQNGDNELKKIATGIIKSNEEDGVAKYLIENFKK